MKESSNNYVIHLHKNVSLFILFIVLNLSISKTQWVRGNKKNMQKSRLQIGRTIYCDLHISRELYNKNLYYAYAYTLYTAKLLHFFFWFFIHEKGRLYFEGRLINSRSRHIVTSSLRLDGLVQRGQLSLQFLRIILDLG